MKKLALLLVALPVFLMGQNEFPSYANGEGQPFSFLDPAVQTENQPIIWVPAEEFWGKYAFSNIFYVTRENENHAGGMHQSWNITYLNWEGDRFSEMWHVHYDTTLWDVDQFVEALPALADTRAVNGTDYYFNEEGFLIDWGFTGYGVGSRYHFECVKQPEGYYLQLFSTDEFEPEESKEFVAYRFLNHKGMPQHSMYMEGESLAFLHGYVHDLEQNFLRHTGEDVFVEKLNETGFYETSKRYQLYANNQHFADQVKQAFGYFPQHILVGFWRFGYIRFSYSEKDKKYFLEQIVPIY